MFAATILIPYSKRTCSRSEQATIRLRESVFKLFIDGFNHQILDFLVYVYEKEEEEKSVENNTHRCVCRNSDRCIDHFKNLTPIFDGSTAVHFAQIAGGGK
uniref:Uncharacterized protein n=1 Tax=Romanomermis culicivorax TaxID=13658 RepID=A0A915JX31_ROMCU